MEQTATGFQSSIRKTVQILISIHIHRTGILQVHGTIPIDEIISFLSTRENGNTIQFEMAI